MTGGIPMTWGWNPIFFLVLSVIKKNPAKKSHGYSPYILSIHDITGGLVAIFWIFPWLLGMSSSQLTKSYFSEGWLNHQPDNHYMIHHDSSQELEALRGLGDLWPRLRRIAVEVHGSDVLRKLKERSERSGHKKMGDVPKEEVIHKPTIWGFL